MHGVANFGLTPTGESQEIGITATDVRSALDVFREMGFHKGDVGEDTTAFPLPWLAQLMLKQKVISQR